MHCSNCCNRYLCLLILLYYITLTFSFFKISCNLNVLILRNTYFVLTVQSYDCRINNIHLLNDDTRFYARVASECCIERNCEPNTTL